jgi:hypothetical protein
LLGVKSLFDYGVCTLDIEFEVAILRVPEQDAHPFAVRVELHAAEDFKFNVLDQLPLGNGACFPRGSRLLLSDLGARVIPEVEFEAMLLSKFDQSDLIRGGSLVKDLRSTPGCLLGLGHALMSGSKKLQELYDKCLLMLNPESDLS